MNLLKDNWIPVHHQHIFKHINLQTLLTQDESWYISLPRDDMEMACLQLLVSLTQVLFTPEDGDALKLHIKHPLTDSEYLAAIETKVDWFELDHPDMPFMQCRGVSASTTNSMTKLFAGFTESTSGAFVNEPGLADSVCPSCASIGLFNQANNCASFCGGAKGSIRGNEKDGELKSGIPITTFMSGKYLRETIWLNILTRESIGKYLCLDNNCNDLPNWIDTVQVKGISNSKIKQGEEVYLNKLGIARGLFWQPQHIELVQARKGGYCDCCGVSFDVLYDGFLFEKFSYTYRGIWIHPHSPMKWEIKQGERKLGYKSFTGDMPVWTHLVGLLIDKDNDTDGSKPASVVSQYRSYFSDRRESSFLVGGYWNVPGKASIKERLHELFSFSGGAISNNAKIDRIVTDGLRFKSALNDNLYSVAKQISKTPSVPKPLQRLVGGMQAKGIKQFYGETKLIVHDALESGTFKENKLSLERYRQQLRKITIDIFHNVTEPYQNEPKMIRVLAVARRGLEKSLAELS